jgi:hypothetical protein
VRTPAVSRARSSAAASAHRGLPPRRYGGLALFFHDQHGGNCVAVKWRPRAFLPAPFSAAGVQHCLLVTRSEARPSAPSFLLPDVANVLEGMRTAGGGLVHQIVTDVAAFVAEDAEAGGGHASA